MNKQFGGNAYQQWLRSQGPGGFHHPARVEDELQRFTWLPFHRLARQSPHFRWWRLLVGAVVFLIVFFVLQFVLMLAVLLSIFGLDSDFGELWAQTVADPDPKLLVIMTFASLAVGIPAVWLAAVCSRREWGFMWSVAGRIRWDVFGLALRSAAPVFGVWLALMLMSTWLAEGSDIFAFSLDAAVYLLLVVVLIPFQCTAEELVFRGWLPQVLGAWIKNPVVCYVLPTLGFTVLHDYPLVQLVDVCVFGLAAAYMTYRTGGIEAGMVLHILNNVMLFTVLGFVTERDFQEMLVHPQQTDVWSDLAAVVFSSAMTLGAAALVLRNKKLRAACGNAQLRVEQLKVEQGS